MTQLIDRIVEISQLHGGRPSAEDLAQLLQDKGAWDFAGADPLASVRSALAAERQAPEPRVVRFFDAYALRGPRRRQRTENGPDPQRATSAPQREEDLESAGPYPPARHELTGEGPRLLLDLLQGPRLVDHLDGRTVAALVRNDCAVVQNRWVSATAGARAAMRRHLISLGRSSRGRAAALFPAIAELVDSIPAGSEIQLQSGPTAAADVLIALYDAALATDRRTPHGTEPRCPPGRTTRTSSARGRVLIDRPARDRAAEWIRRFASGRIHNDEFADEFPQSGRDPALALKGRGWSLYSDHRTHYLTGDMALGAQGRRDFPDNEGTEGVTRPLLRTHPG